MKNTITYKGYIGSVEFSQEDGIFFGKIQGIRSLISYEGTNASELIKDFQSSIDEYLDSCKKEGVDPEIAYKGSFNVRLSSETHRMAAIYAIEHNQSLNSFIEDAVKEKLLTVKS